jgi:hypothetical protein
VHACPVEPQPRLAGDLIKTQLRHERSLDPGETRAQSAAEGLWPAR